MDEIKLENFIPFDKRELFLFLKEKIEDKKNREEFEKFYNLIEFIYDNKFSKKLEEIKESYLYIDPDLNIQLLGNINEVKKNEDIKNVVNKIKDLLKAGNYIEITKDKIIEAFNKSSPWGIDLKVNLEEFDECILFYKGEFKDSRKKKFFFMEKEYDFNVYSRVVFIFKLKPQKKTRKDNLSYDKVYIKLFKNVPAVDLEMLFPNTKIMIKPLDKMLIILPLIAGISTTIYKVVDYIIKQGSSGTWWSQLGFWGIVGGFFGLALHSFSGYQSTVEKYLRSLTSNLYFQNLDNNSGVYHYLINNAIEEECKEIVLAYYFLYFSKEKLTIEELDKKIENFFINNFGKKIDFEVDDAMRKIKELGLLRKEDTFIEIFSIQEAVKILKKQIEEMF
ncbi:MAG TPA: DUF3754 domain-containing protein [Spirochaetota bacterium]|nr:DUF3754 domain-containing protein [Spirochaetota bacterium]HOL58017.1 DUF3754 domain-containing protein [Spirochaetota bacterium]HPP05650.1 DUF3754 domain-containing protein [Spirochaetota bacterium]